MMMTTSALRAGAVACALLGTTCLTSPAFAQAGPSHINVDGNGVDLVTGQHRFEFVEASIGSGAGELALVRRRPEEYSQWDGIYLDQSDISGALTINVSFNGQVDRFTGTITSLTAAEGNGATLTYGGVGSGAGYIYRAANGTTISFGDPTSGGPASTYCNFSGTQPSCRLMPATITSPDAGSVDLSWDVASYCSMPENFGDPMECDHFVRLSNVSNSRGYSAAFTYASNTAGGARGGSPSSDWYRRTGAGLFNNVVSTSTPQASVAYSRPSTDVYGLTDPAGRTWQFTANGSGFLTGVRRPGDSSDATSIAYSGFVVSAVTRDGVTTNYSHSVSGSTATTVVTNALSQQTTIVSNLTIGQPTSVTDALSHTTSYQYDSFGRLTRVTQPEGNYVQYTYDSRGNVTQTQMVSKTSPASGTLTTSGVYPSSCTNPVTCNQPTSTTDARGNTTDYTYDSTHGGVLTVTAPAPTSGATRPQTRYAYTLSNGEYLLTGVSACQTTSSCTDGADETRTVITYDSQGNVTSTQQRNGTNSLNATTSMTYDNQGNLLTVDGPLSGTADTTRHRYNAARQLIGTVGPDPDGVGALKHRATRITLRTDTLLSAVQRGTVNSQSDTDWAAFTALEEVQTDYDSYDRPTVQRLMSGSTTYALTQTSYDSVGRVDCVAQRMNSATYGSLPAACTPATAGAYGDDRITRTTYDAVGRATLVQTGYGITGVQANEVTTGYTNNGRPYVVTDAEGNQTVYDYDGHDRLVGTYFPHPSSDNTTNWSDFERYTLDANGNVINRQLRDGQHIGYTYDALNRRTFMDVPGSDLTPAFSSRWS